MATKKKSAASGTRTRRAAAAARIGTVVATPGGFQLKLDPARTFLFHGQRDGAAVEIVTRPVQPANGVSLIKSIVDQVGLGSNAEFQDFLRGILAKNR